MDWEEEDFEEGAGGNMEEDDFEEGAGGEDDMEIDVYEDVDEQSTGTPNPTTTSVRTTRSQSAAAGSTPAPTTTATSQTTAARITRSQSAATRSTSSTAATPTSPPTSPDTDKAASAKSAPTTAASTAAVAPKAPVPKMRVSWFNMKKADLEKELNEANVTWRLGSTAHDLRQLVRQKRADEKVPVREYPWRQFEDEEGGATIGGAEPQTQNGRRSPHEGHAGEQRPEVISVEQDKVNEVEAEAQKEAAKNAVQDGLAHQLKQIADARKRMRIFWNPLTLFAINRLGTLMEDLAKFIRTMDADLTPTNFKTLLDYEVIDRTWPAYVVHNELIDAGKKNPDGDDIDYILREVARRSELKTIDTINNEEHRELYKKLVVECNADLETKLRPTGSDRMFLYHRLMKNHKNENGILILNYMPHFDGADGAKTFKALSTITRRRVIDILTRMGPEVQEAVATMSQPDDFGIMPPGLLTKLKKILGGNWQNRMEIINSYEKVTEEWFEATMESRRAAAIYRCEDMHVEILKRILRCTIRKAHFALSHAFTVTSPFPVAKDIIIPEDCPDSVVKDKFNPRGGGVGFVADCKLSGPTVVKGSAEIAVRKGADREIWVRKWQASGAMINVPVGGFWEGRPFKHNIRDHLQLTHNVYIILRFDLRKIPLTGSDDSRGPQKPCGHWGVWERSSVLPFASAHTMEDGALGDASRLWMVGVQRGIWYMEGKFHYFNEKLHRMYSVAAQAAGAPFGPWCAAAANFSWATADHLDEKDWKGGYCWVIATGKWTGGNLYFRQLNLEIYMEPGDIVCFKSALLWHKNLHIDKGVRNSIVLYTDDVIMKRMEKAVDEIESEGAPTSMSLKPFRFDDDDSHIWKQLLPVRGSEARAGAGSRPKAKKQKVQQEVQVTNKQNSGKRLNGNVSELNGHTGKESAGPSSEPKQKKQKLASNNQKSIRGSDKQEPKEKFLWQHKKPPKPLPKKKKTCRGSKGSKNRREREEYEKNKDL
ncbi:hypothetical protein HK097_007455 [Rhizophlyctis rosea]|uniref:Uncharacterized protein n=1 Tax=Rhizophlyctis rosea TaxID=64517 RepID=A0AAD5SBM6_9FUNG|nr:hypothetical protein HK097_007455 [Rhizophlyctis rosea]